MFRGDIPRRPGRGGEVKEPPTHAGPGRGSAARLRFGAGVGAAVYSRSFEAPRRWPRPASWWCGRGPCGGGASCKGSSAGAVACPHTPGAVPRNRSALQRVWLLLGAEGTYRAKLGPLPRSASATLADCGSPSLRPAPPGWVPPSSAQNAGSLRRAGEATRPRRRPRALPARAACSTGCRCCPSWPAAGLPRRCWGGPGRFRATRPELASFPPVRGPVPRGQRAPASSARLRRTRPPGSLSGR